LEVLVQVMGDKETERRMMGIGLTLDSDIGDSELGMDTVVTSNDTTVEVPGHPKCRKAPRQQDIDALNGCLCGEVLQPSSNGVLKCKQAGCDTISDVYHWRLHPATGFVTLAKRLV